MRKAILLVTILCVGSTAWAGFKVKLVKPKKPEQFQARSTVAGVTYAADLLLEGKDQKDYFYKELAASNIIAVRLAVFNGGKGEVLLPLDGLQLRGPDGTSIPLIAPDTVAKAILQGLVVTSEVRDKKPVAVAPNVRTGDPRTDRTDPRYDPTLDPTDPRYDPNDPRNRRHPNDPGYDPNDPRNRRQGPYGRNDPWFRPGVDVILNPGGGAGGGDLSQFEKQLVEKDFQDKAHSVEPILNSLSRDKFLYFSVPERPASSTGFRLLLPTSKGIPEEVTLKF